MNDITNIVSKEITEKTLDLGSDFAEIALDQFIKNQLLAEVPIVKSILAFYNVGNSVINRHNTKKIIIFFQEFNRKEINDLKFNQFKHKFNTDQKYRNEVTETIVLMNERFLQVEKSKILANLIIAHIEDNLNWDDLSEIITILDVVQTKAFTLLEELSKLNWYSSNFNKDVRQGLLVATGLGYMSGNQLRPSEIGKQLFIYGIEPINR